MKGTAGISHEMTYSVPYNYACIFEEHFINAYTDKYIVYMYYNNTSDRMSRITVIVHFIRLASQNIHVRDTTPIS